MGFQPMPLHPGLMHKNAKILFLGLDNAGKTVSPLVSLLKYCVLKIRLEDSFAHAEE